MPRAPRARTVNWDWARLLRDAKVEDMGPLALGAWTRILGALYEAETPGLLFVSEDSLRHIARCDRRAWSRVRAQVLGCLETLEYGYRHRATETEHREQSRRISETRERRARAANLRWNKDTRDAHAVHEHSSSNANAMQEQESSTARAMPPSLPHSLTPTSEAKSKAAAPPGASPIASLLPALAEALKPYGDATVRTGIALATRLAKGGLAHGPLLLRIARHYGENAPRVRNPFAYYNAGGQGFAAIKMRVAADMATEEHEAIKAAEAAWQKGLAPS